MYTVVGCSDCESVKIVHANPETTVYNRCQSQIDLSRARVIFRSEDLEEAKEARSVAMAKRDGFDYLVDEIVDQEIVKEDITRVASEGLMEEEMERAGVDTSEVERAGEVETPKTDGESKPQLRIVKDAIEFLDSPTDDDVVEFAVERGVPAGKVEEIVDRMCVEGEAMRTRDGEIRML